MPIWLYLTITIFHLRLRVKSWTPRLWSDLVGSSSSSSSASPDPSPLRCLLMMPAFCAPSHNRRGIFCNFVLFFQTFNAYISFLFRVCVLYILSMCRVSVPCWFRIMHWILLFWCESVGNMFFLGFSLCGNVRIVGDMFANIHRRFCGFFFLNARMCLIPFYLQFLLFVCSVGIMHAFRSNIH